MPQFCLLPGNWIHNISWKQYCQKHVSLTLTLFLLQKEFKEKQDLMCNTSSNLHTFILHFIQDFRVDFKKTEYVRCTIDHIQFDYCGNSPLRSVIPEEIGQTLTLCFKSVLNVAEHKWAWGHILQGQKLVLVSWRYLVTSKATWISHHILSSKVVFMSTTEHFYCITMWLLETGKAVQREGGWGKGM